MNHEDISSKILDQSRPTPIVAYDHPITFIEKLIVIKLEQRGYIRCNMTKTYENELKIALRGKLSRAEKAYFASRQHIEELYCYYAVQQEVRINRNFVLQYYRLPNIIDLMIIDNKAGINKYLKNLGRYSTQARVELCMDYNILKNMSSYDIYPEISVEHFMRIFKVLKYSAGTPYRIIKYITKMQDRSGELYDYCLENANNTLIYAVLYSLPETHYLRGILQIAPLEADINKVLIFEDDQLDCTEFLKLLETNPVLPDNPRYYEHGLLNPKVLGLALDLKMIQLKKDCTIMQRYLHFEHPDPRPITRYIMDVYPDYVFTLYVGRQIHDIAAYDGPVFLVKLANVLVGRRVYSYFEGQLQEYYRLIAEGKFIIMNSKLLFDEIDCIASVMHNRESFYMHKNCLVEFTNYDAAASLSIKSSRF